MYVDVAVRVSESGSPIAVRAPGSDYVATGRPELWMDRAPWWDEPAQAAALGAAALERERWNVPAVDTAGRQVMVELVHDRHARRWRLLTESLE